MLRVTVLELPATWGHPERVIAEVDALLGAGPPTDLVLLPEASLTGYVSPAGDFDLTRFAESESGPTAHALASVAKRHAVHLVAPLVVGVEGRFYNALAAFAPDGARLFVYRKRHPWFPETWASPGEDLPPVVRIGSLHVTIAICFDVHFLAEDAASALAKADLLLFPSAWVDEEDTRLPLLAGIARRFDIAVANANWSEGVVRLPGQGGSAILDRSGTVIASVLPGSRRADAAIAGTSDAAF